MRKFGLLEIHKSIAHPQRESEGFYRIFCLRSPGSEDSLNNYAVLTPSLDHSLVSTSHFHKAELDYPPYLLITCTIKSIW